MAYAQSYDRISQALHWLLAVLLLFLIAIHPSTEEGHAESGVLVMGIHIVVGMLVLLFVAWRIIWRLRFASIPPEAIGEKWQLRTRKLTYLVFYISMLLAPLLGIVLALTEGASASIFGLIELPHLIDDASMHGILRSLHGMTADVLLYLGLLHFGAAMYHQFYLKDRALDRMLK